LQPTFNQKTLQDGGGSVLCSEKEGRVRVDLSLKVKREGTRYSPQLSKERAGRKMLRILDISQV
jgi:hypothetical protein